MKKYIIISIFVVFLLLIIIGIVLGISYAIEPQHSQPSQSLSIDNNSTTDDKITNINNNNNDASGNNINTPLNVHIISVSDDPSIVRTYNNNSPTTNIKITSHVNKLNETVKKDINTKNLSSTLNSGTSSSQSNSYTYP